MASLLAYPYVRNVKSKLKPTFGFDCDSLDLGQQGVLNLPEAWSKECPRPIASTDSIDSLGFCGVRRDGSVVITRITRRDNRTAEVLLYLRLSNGDQYQLPNHPDVCVYNTDGRSFSAAGLCFEVIEPLRIWRVIFNGYLRKGVRSTWDESDNDVVQVRFNFIWHPVHCYMGFPEDFNVKSMVQLLTSRSWFWEFSSPYNLFTQDWQEQFGQLHGIVTIDNQDVEIMLRGLKSRRHGIPQGHDFNLSFQGVLHNGVTFHLFATCGNLLKNFVYGYVCTADSMRIRHIDECHFDMNSLKKESKFPENFVINFVADGVKYSVKTTIVNETGMTVYPGHQWNRVTNIQNVKILMNNSIGNGIVEIETPNANQSICLFSTRDCLPQLIDLKHITSCNRIVVEFSEDECKSSHIVGGKGSSLALLKSLDYKTRNFSIPEGFCLTKAAFELHIKDNSQLATAIDNLTYTAGHNRDFLEEECKKMYSAVATTHLSDDIKKPIISKLTEIFNDSYESKRFAVRSSAVGEDGEELSAAGQNDTILGEIGLEQICTAVVKCWASQFAFRSVEYKRQNGQPLYAGMGVVIQEMVDADVAGVLFSRDPIKGSPTNMVITSNFGLGESVVSATAEPDYIILRRTWNDKLYPTDHNVIGSKQHMTAMNNDGGTSEITLDSEKCSKLSVDNELALKLGNIALYLENCFGTGRDIEWAVHNQTIYLLQSRPMTGHLNMSDFEIIHEFDGSMKTDDDRYSTANVGEVMPGAQCPLTMTSVCRIQIPVLQKLMTWRITCHRYDPTIVEIVVPFYGHAIQETVQMKMWSLEKKKSNMTKAMEVGFYGRVLDDDEVVKMALERFTNPPLKSRLTLVRFSIQGLLYRSSILKDAVKKYQKYQDPSLAGKTVEEVFSLLGEHMRDFINAMLKHMSITMSSTIWNLATLNIITVGNGDFELDQYADFALLIGSCNGAESGNVPFSLQELAACVAKEIDPERFLALDTQEALEWLQKNDNEAGRKYRDFIERHGHRGLKEFDMSCTSWAMDPSQIISVLQNMLKSPAACKAKEEKTLDDVIGAIKTPLNPMKRKLLKWVLTKCRQGVCNRELTKSCAIKVYEGFRLGFRRLATMMVAEGLIPDANLIFFFTLDEIGRLIKTRSPLLIQRAKQRLRLHPYMDKLKFEEMMTGFPIPIDMNEKIILPGDSVEIKGYPVSQGKIEGRARVIITFHDVNTIQPGEILVTHATDIGWSPYFPMLGGVVTELGGLISHGAVVAREFGLPCIVGAQNATRVFNTGDIILLDATKGTITRVAKTQDVEDS